MIWYLKHKKRLQCECVTLTNGGVKTGKSTLSVYLALKYYKKNLRKWKIRKFFGKKEEKPLLYSNIPLKTKYGYVPITKDLLERKKRFAFGSVAYIGEFSLVADSMLFKDQLLNEELLLFMKLFGHETHGSGKLFLDTQALGDCHFAVKRCISRYIYIERSIKWIPFFLVYKVREMYYSDDGSVMNVSTADLEEDANKFLLVPKSVWKKFDYTCYSIFTDDLDVVTDVVKEPGSLKATNVPSFKTYQTLDSKFLNNGGVKNGQ